MDIDWITTEPSSSDIKFAEWQAWLHGNYQRQLYAMFGIPTAMVKRPCVALVKYEPRRDPWH